MAESKAPSIWKKVADKLGLDFPVVLLMIKYGNWKLILPLRSYRSRKLTLEL